MMPAWLTWSALRSLPWKYIGISLAAMALVLLIWRAPWAESRQKAKDQVTIQRLTEQRDGFRANQDKLTAALNRQNATVAALKVEGERRKADGARALKAAEKVNQSLSDQAAALRKSAGRKVDATRCPISDTLKQAGAV